MIKRNKRFAGVVAIIIFMSLLAQVCFSQGNEIELTATVDADKIGLDDILYFTVQVKGKDLSDVPVPSLPDIEGFSILGTSRSTSQQFQIIGNKAESSVSYNYIYTLKPQKKGVFNVPSVKIIYKNVSYSTTPIKIEVKEGSIKKTAPQRRRSVFDDFFDDNDRNAFDFPRSRASDQREITDEIILERSPADAEVYVGGQIILNTYLYAADVDIFNLAPSSDPSLDGFWIEETTLNPQETRTQVQRGGRLYTRFTLRRQVLFPTKAGDFSIPPMSLEMDSRRLGFGVLGFTQKVRRQSNLVKVKVMPLPRDAMPGDFTGAVGNFDIEAKLNKAQATVGEAVNLVITYKGTGNMKDFRAPELKENPDFTLYGPEQAQDFGLRGSIWGGEKTWKYILVPKTPGETVFGPFNLTFFDPETKKYITKSSGSLKLQVKEGTLSNSIPAYTGQIPELQQNDINYISDVNGEIEDESKLLLQMPAAWILMALPVLVNLGILTFGFVQARRKVNVAAFRLRRASSEAVKTLKEASRAAQKKETQKAYDFIIKAFAGYFADKWNTVAGGLTLEQVRKRLENTNADIGKNVIEFLEECEYCRFAGSKIEDKSKMDEMVAMGKNLLRELERKLK
jgi:hypothetical protein